MVISGEALAESAASKLDRARITQTIPGHTRSNPLTSGAAPFATAASSSAIDDTYPPLKRRGSILPLVLAGALLVAAAGLLFTQLRPNPASEATNGAPTALPLQASESPVAAAAPPPPAEAPAPPEPVASADSKTNTAAPEPTPAPEPPPAKKTKAKKVVAPAPRRSAPRTEPRAEAKPIPATEPTASPTPKPAKGVIVRETPF